MPEFKQYRKKQLAEMRPYEQGESMEGISVGLADAKNGSPKMGDMIARSATDHNNQWLVSKEFFNENYESV